jgi:hypothetical protein
MYCGILATAFRLVMFTAEGVEIEVVNGALLEVSIVSKDGKTIAPVPCSALDAASISRR